MTISNDTISSISFLSDPYPMQSTLSGVSLLWIPKWFLKSSGCLFKEE